MTDAHAPLLVVGPVRVVMACEDHCIVLLATEEHGGLPTAVAAVTVCTLYLRLGGPPQLFSVYEDFFRL